MNNSGLGYNLFKCKSVDGLLDCELKVAGNIGHGEVYAKQLQGNGNLKILGEWYRKMGAEVGDKVMVTWKSSEDLEIELKKK